MFTSKGHRREGPAAHSKLSFYNLYFFVPKKDGCPRPILDLRHLNHALMKWLFKMLTLKQILSQIYPGDCIFFVDLKDAYFHIHSPQSQTREIHVRGGGLPIYCPSVWTVSGTLQIYKVCGRSPLPPVTEGSVRPE